MPDIKATVNQIRDVLGAERRECLWESGTYARSNYVYISKKSITEIERNLTHIEESCALLEKIDAEIQTTTRKLENCEVEMEHIASDNDQLRHELRSQIVVLHGKEARIEQLFLRLKELRGVFGSSITHEELQALLKRVDEVLSG